MKQIHKYFTIQTLLVVVVLLLPAIVHAQDPAPGDPDAPIDGGLSLLVAAGVGYGVKKIHGKKRKQESDK